MRAAVVLLLLLLLGAGSLAGEELVERRFAVRIDKEPDATTVARHLFSDKAWPVGFAKKPGSLLLLRVHAGHVTGTERLVPVFFRSRRPLATCRVYAAYVVPKGKPSRGRWEARIKRCMKSVCAFWERELLGLVDFRIHKTVAVRSKRTEREYRESKLGFHGQAVADAVHRASVPHAKQKGTWPVLVVFIEGQKKGGGGCAGSFREDRGVAVISGEVLPFLYLEDEVHPGRVDDPLRGGKVSWDWGLGAVAHEFGHAIGLPHPRPGDGSVMSGGWLRGLGQTTLGERQKRLMLEPAANVGYVTRWQIAGPFDGCALDGAPPKRARWKDVVTEGPYVDLERLLRGREEAHAYARVWIRSESQRSTTFFAGSDDTIRVWLNGEVIHWRSKKRGWSLDQDKLRGRLAAGWNELVVACGNGPGHWGFSLRIGGEGAQTLRVQATPPR